MGRCAEENWRRECSRGSDSGTEALGLFPRLAKKGGGKNAKTNRILRYLSCEGERMLILGVETSCDETSVAILRDGREILCNLIASQVVLHSRYGGVVPEIACRKHLEVLNPLLAEALETSGLRFRDIDAVAVTRGPGLVGALLVGVAAAKAIAAVLKVPLIGVNHLGAHIYANFLEHPEIEFPFLSLLVSGGHTALVLVTGHAIFEKLGETRDDAAGESFDKVARALSLGYPGGPIIDRMAREGSCDAVLFPRPMMEQGSMEFSFSGLKTAVVNFLRSSRACEVRLEDICASFQEAVIDVLVAKTIAAAKERSIRILALAGGVACNSLLRRRLSEEVENLGWRLFYPSPILCTDNAAMVACAGYHLLRSGREDDLYMDVDPNLKPANVG